MRSLITLNLSDVVDALPVVDKKSLSVFSLRRTSCFRSLALLRVVVVRHDVGCVGWLLLFGSGWGLLNVALVFANGGYSVMKLE